MNVIEMQSELFDSVAAQRWFLTDWKRLPPLIVQPGFPSRAWPNYGNGAVDGAGASRIRRLWPACHGDAEGQFRLLHLLGADLR